MRHKRRRRARRARRRRRPRRRPCLGSSSGVMPRQMPASASVGRFSTVPFGQTISGSSSAETPARSTTARPSASSAGIEHRVGIAVAAEKALQAARVRACPACRPARSPTPPSSISPTRRRMKARIMISPTSAEPIIRARTCAASNGSAVQPSGPARPEASVPRPASWLTSPENWPAPMRGDRRLVIEAVAAARRRSSP